MIMNLLPLHTLSLHPYLLMLLVILVPNPNSFILSIAGNTTKALGTEQKFSTITTPLECLPLADATTTTTSVTVTEPSFELVLEFIEVSLTLVNDGPKGVGAS